MQNSPFNSIAMKIELVIDEKGKLLEIWYVGDTVADIFPVDGVEEFYGEIQFFTDETDFLNL